MKPWIKRRVLRLLDRPEVLTLLHEVKARATAQPAPADPDPDAEWRTIRDRTHASPQYAELSRISSSELRDNVIVHETCPICRSPRILLAGGASVTHPLVVEYDKQGALADPLFAATVVRLLEVFGEGGVTSEVWVCFACGALFLSPVLSDLLKMRFVTGHADFTSAPACQELPRTQEVEAVAAGERDILLTASQRVVKMARLCRLFLGPRATAGPLAVLDIGSRGGANSVPLTANPESLVTLIESDVALRPARNGSRVEAYSGLVRDFLAATGATRRYDVILALHVLEHVAHPRDFLEDVCELLHDDGIAIIEVPYEKGCARATAAGYYYQWNHSHLFTPTSFRTLLELMERFEIVSYELEADANIPGLHAPQMVLTAVVRRTRTPHQALALEPAEARYRVAKALDELTQTFAGSVACFASTPAFAFVRDPRDVPLLRPLAELKVLKGVMTDNRELSGRLVDGCEVAFCAASAYADLRPTDVVLFLNPQDAEYFRLHCSPTPILV